MITDLRDLEPLLGQYDPGLILVGPVLSFSGGYRYFYIAANGSQVYEAIGLGYFENEADAESQRANIIEIVKSRFTEMLSFDSHWEMAHGANTRWSNEETAKVLASAKLFEINEPELDGSIDNISHVQVDSGDYGRELVDEVAPEPVDLADEAVPRGALPPVLDETRPAQSLSPANMSVRATPQQGQSGGSNDILAIPASELALGPPNQSQSAPELPAVTTNSTLGDDRVAGEQQGHSGHNDDDITAILRALRPSFQSQNAPMLPATTTNSPPSRDRAVSEQHRHSEYSKEDIAAVSRALKLPSAPMLPAATPSSRLNAVRVLREQQGRTEQSGDLLAIMASFSRPDLDQNDVAARSRALGPSDRPQSVPWLKGARSLVSLVLLICAVTGVSALLTWAMLRPGTPPMANNVPTAATKPTASAPQSLPDQQAAANSIPPPQPSQDPGAQGGIVPPPAQLQATEANEPPRPVEPATAAAPSPPPPQSLQAAGTQAGAAPVSGPDHQAEASEPARQVEPATAAVPPSSPPQASQGAGAQTGAAPVSGPDHQAEASEPTQQVEPATASVPPSPPPQSSQGAGTQTGAAPASGPDHQAAASEPTRQVEPATAAVPPSPPPQSSQVASTQTGAAPASEPQQAPAQGSSTASSLDPQEITALIDRGTALLKRGDLATARLLLRRAAEAGSADAALMLGSTFDPHFIQQLGAIGIEPDVARARQWYEKAAVLGSEAASQRLADLNNQ